MRTTNFTDLRNNLKKYLDAVTNDSDTVIINRDGGTGAVLISLDEYNAIKETEYIMSSPAMMEAIREGERDIKEGRFVSQQPGESISDFVKSGQAHTVKKIAAILEDIAAHPYTGIGKPEALKYELSGMWSRRINAEHRIIYKVLGEVVEVQIMSMRYHYVKA